MLVEYWAVNLAEPLVVKMVVMLAELLVAHLVEQTVVMMAVL